VAEPRSAGPARALQQGDSKRAAELFENPAWAGTAAYQGGEYDTAAEAFARADDADGWYNRGNALARAGQLDPAIEAYKESLQRAPDREDARENLALLEQLKQEREQNQEQQQSQDQQQNQQQSQDQQQDQQQSQEQQQNQEQQQGQEPQQQDQNQQQETGQEEEAQQQPAAEREDSQDEAASEAMQQAAADPQTQERDQAMEQWLRRVPDDPSGLLREKFRYESYQRQQQGAVSENDVYW
jgi:Ca-activated chloride channel family protein